MANNGMGMAVMALVVLAAGGLAWVLARWPRRGNQAKVRSTSRLT